MQPEYSESLINTTFEAYSGPVARDGNSVIAAMDATHREQGPHHKTTSQTVPNQIVA